MTPIAVQLRLLRSRQEAVRTLQHEIEFTTPMDESVSELRAVLAEEWEAIQREILTLQRERQRNAAYCGIG